MIAQIKREAENRMKKSIEAFQSELGKIRTGRAHPGLLEHIQVSYYGNDVPLNQVANVTVGDARTLLVAPWEKTMIPVVEKAILMAELGLNPATSGNMIRVPLPPLSEERRREMTKIVRDEAEKCRVAVRNVRRDANTHLKDVLKKKEVSEDEERRAQDEVQKLTDKLIAEVDKLLAQKEKELMEV